MVLRLNLTVNTEHPALLSSIRHPLSMKGASGRFGNDEEGFRMSISSIGSSAAIYQPDQSPTTQVKPTSTKTPQAQTEASHDADHDGDTDGPGVDLKG